MIGLPVGHRVVRSWQIEIGIRCSCIEEDSSSSTCHVYHLGTMIHFIIILYSTIRKKALTSRKTEWVVHALLDPYQTTLNAIRVYFKSSIPTRQTVLPATGTLESL